MTSACDNTSITYSKITRQEPTAIVWQNPNCTGNRADILPGQYANLRQANAAMTNVSGIWVPPNMYLDAYSVENDPNADPEDWIRPAPFGTFEAGFYPDLSNPQVNDIPRNTIKSFNIDRRKRWDEHLRNCCTGKSINGASPQVCGDWWGKGNHGAECDELMDAICGHPGLKPDRRCGCYSQPMQSTDTSEMALVRASPICYSQECNIYGYIPSNLDRGQCPPVTVCQTTTQDLSNMTTLVTTRDCNSSNLPVVVPPPVVNTGSTTTTTPSTNTTTPTNTTPSTNTTIEPPVNNTTTTNNTTVDPSTTPSTTNILSMTNLFIILIVFIIACYLTLFNKGDTISQQNIQSV
jgi:hypothetical protein